MDVRMIEDRLTGSAARLREMYRSAFSDMEVERCVLETKKQNRRMALLIIVMIFVAALAGVTEARAQKNAALDLERPETGAAPKTVAAEVEAEYDGYVTKQQVGLRILPKSPDIAEAEELIRALTQRLPMMILAENKSADAVTSDVFLPEIDAETGAELSWSSSDPRVISRAGTVNLIGAETGTVVTLTAYIRLGETQDTCRIAVKTGKTTPEDQMGAALSERLTETVKAVGSAQAGERALLPEVTGDGVRLKWTPPESNGNFLVLFVCAALAFLCFNFRYRSAARKIEAARTEIERDFPDFIQKLGLLLDAGMVITSAMRRVAEDYIETRDVYGRRRLYEELAALDERMRAGNTPLVYEFSDLARRSNLRELMRFGSILADNIDKGSTLADKLRAENELLWESRKKRAEKEGRVAETKLIFPMVLQILAIIAVTVMPAAFEMG